MDYSGVYKITNTNTGLVYIGSSGNIKKRWKEHKGYLNLEKHANGHLQNSWNKHGEEVFKFEVLEKVPKEDIKNVEQEYLNRSDFTKLYNISKSAYGPSQEEKKNPLFLLSINGNIIDKFDSGTAVNDYINYGKQLVYNKINTSATFKGKYRVVTPDFYEDNLDTIKSWPYFTSYHRERKRQCLLQTKVYRFIKNETTILTTDNLEDAVDFYQLTKERIRQLSYKENKYHKKSGIRMEVYILADIINEDWFVCKTLYKKLIPDGIGKKLRLSMLNIENWKENFYTGSKCSR